MLGSVVAAAPEDPDPEGTDPEDPDPEDPDPEDPDPEAGPAPGIGEEVPLPPDLPATTPVQPAKNTRPYIAAGFAAPSRRRNALLNLPLQNFDAMTMTGLLSAYTPCTSSAVTRLNLS